jgi:hypothetical protein
MDAAQEPRRGLLLLHAWVEDGTAGLRVRVSVLDRLGAGPKTLDRLVPERGGLPGDRDLAEDFRRGDGPVTTR